MPDVNSALSGVTRLAFDTAPVIYFIEANPQYDPVVSEIFKRIDDGGLHGVSSVISLLEVLVVLIRSGDTTLQREYTDLLLHSSNFTTAEITSSVAVKAAELRSQYSLRTPDAIQVANAIVNGCEAILTNDVSLKRIPEIRILILDDLSL